MGLPTRRDVLKLGLAGLAGAAYATPAMSLVRIVVSGASFVPLPIAVPDFQSSDPAFGRQVAEIVRADLRRSGLFAPIDLANMPLAIGNVSINPDFASWAQTGAQALLMGQVERGGQVQSSMRLWDVEAGAQMIGQTYSTAQDSWRRIAHIMADAIYAELTGETAYFDTRVVYVAESGPKANRTKRLAIMDYDGANVQYLTPGRALALTPRYSPGSNLLAYINFEDGQPQVYLLELSSGRQQRIGNFGAMTFSPRFSPDGGSLAFSVETGGTTNLYSLQLGTKSPAQLTNSSAIDTSPSYSPDGSMLSFESDRGGSPQIYVMGARGGGAQRISYGEGTYSTPVWSPKGDLIAFTRQHGGQFHIGTMKPDGSGERILASSFHMEGPTWAPNGRVIMYFSDPGGDGGPRLHSVDVWGRNPLQVPTETFASDPSWSPLRT